jgi:multiple sugar transport system substrate-binding protein
MLAADIVPLAFADKDGWPAMGTFDILNMRQNGYQFHVDLMAGKEKWTDSRVKDVFELWKELMPYLQPNALGRTWQEGAQSMISKEAGMYFLGTFASQQATAQADYDDLDFFPFPVLGNQWDSENGIDAPIDGLMLSKAPKNPEGAKALLECVATGRAQLEYLKSDPGNVAAAKDFDTSSYTTLQKKMAEIIGNSGAIAQFLDRDTRPDFAGGNGMQAFLQTFLNDPDQNLDTYLGTIQSFYDSLPPQ